MLDVLKVEGLLLDEGKDTTGGSDQNVRAELLVAENVLISLDGGTTIEDLRANFGQVLAEAGVLVLDLEGQLAGVAEDNNRDLTRDSLDLLERGEDKDGSLTHTRLSLAENIHSEDGLGDALLLDYWS